MSFLVYFRVFFKQVGLRINPSQSSRKTVIARGGGQWNNNRDYVMSINVNGFK